MILTCQFHFDAFPLSPHNLIKHTSYTRLCATRFIRQAVKHLFPLSPFLPITLSPYHPFSLSPYHPFSLSPFLPITLSPYHPFSLSPFLLFSSSPFLLITSSNIPIKQLHPPLRYALHRAKQLINKRGGSLFFALAPNPSNQSGR
jgi:hypothetical protein